MTVKATHGERDVAQSSFFLIRFLVSLYQAVKIAWARLKELIIEFPQIIKGISFFWKPFKKQMIIIALMNVVIFLVEIGVAFVASKMVDIYVDAESYSYLQLFGLIVAYYMGLRVIHEICLPFVREWFIARYFKFDFIGYVANECVGRSLERGLDKLEKDRQPAIIDGSNAVFLMTQALLREPIVALRGIIILLSFSLQYPLLVLVAFSFMAIDLIIIFHMDSNLWSRQKAADESSFHAWGSVAEALDAPEAIHRSDVQMQEVRMRCETQFAVYKEKNAALEIAKLKYKELLRNTLDQVFDLITYGALLFWVQRGEMSYGELTFYIGLLGRAQGPFHVIYNFQQMVMNMRPALHRLDQMCNIGINITAPKAV